LLARPVPQANDLHRMTVDAVADQVGPYGQEFELVIGAPRKQLAPDRLMRDDPSFIGIPNAIGPGFGLGLGLSVRFVEDAWYRIHSRSLPQRTNDASKRPGLNQNSWRRPERVSA
jgi:hypothetical protein